MPKVEIKKNQVWVGKKGISLVSGEVHYWRLNPSRWKEILESVREMGLDVVSTYVPWHYHEYQRGKFDFTGKTDETHNLKAFLDLTKKMGFWLVIRPGPYIYSEWPNDGVPDYAHKYHRLHPKFLEYAEDYIKRVTKVYAPYLASKRGGHIIMVQADNEIDPWPDLFGQQYGLVGKPGLFQEFLKRTYNRNILDLNERWGTKYKNFEEAGPYIATMLNDSPGLPLKGDHELRRNLDYFKFKYDYSKQVAKWNVEAYKKVGVDVPIYTNVYPFFYAHDWVDFQEVSDLVGLDAYPSSEFGEDEYEQRKFVDKVRYLTQTSSISFIAEFSSGVWHNRHYESGVLTGNHYRLLVLSAILGGCNGWNWYMLVNRDNWYMSPINEWGTKRGELYSVFQQMVSVFKKINPPTLTKVTEVGSTFNHLQYAARTLTHNSPILVALYSSDVDYDLYDPRSKKFPSKCLFYSGNQWLEVESQKNMRRYVEEGGTLIAFRDYPRKDERFHPCSIVGFEDPKCTLFEFRRNFDVQLAPGRPKITINSSVYCFDVKGVKKIETDFGGGYGKNTIGYIKKVGKGQIIHLGVEPKPELIVEILDYLKIEIASHAKTSDIKTALFKRGSKFYLIATNNGDEDKSASVLLPAMAKVKGKMLVKNLISGTQEKISAERRDPFTFEIPRKDGLVFEFSSTK